MSEGAKWNAFTCNLSSMAQIEKQSYTGAYTCGNGQANIDFLSIGHCTWYRHRTELLIIMMMIQFREINKKTDSLFHVLPNQIYAKGGKEHHLVRPTDDFLQMSLLNEPIVLHSIEREKIKDVYFKKRQFQTIFRLNQCAKATFTRTIRCGVSVRNDLCFSGQFKCCTIRTRKIDLNVESFPTTSGFFNS